MNVQELSSNLINKSRKKLFSWFLNLNLSLFSEPHINEIAELISYEVKSIVPLISTPLISAIENILYFLICIIISLSYNLRIGLLCLSSFILLIICVSFLNYFNRKIEVKSNNLGFISDTLSNVKIIKIFNTQNNFLQFFDNMEINTKNYSQDHILTYVYYSCYYLFYNILFIIICYFGGIFINKYKYFSLAEFVISLFVFFTSLTISKRMLKFLTEFNNMRIKVENINELINKKYRSFNNLKANKSKLQGIIKSSNPQNILGKIEFKNVSFSESGKKNKILLNNISFLINPGTKVAFVGSAGCGKTSIINLLLRFSKPNSGEIFLDDKNIYEYDEEELRDYFTGVFDNPDLLERSINENVRYGDKNASREEYLNVANYAGLPEVFVDELNRQTIYQISIGQIKRIALARCLLKKRKIMFFDDITSDLDLNSEKIILRNLEGYFMNSRELKTVLFTSQKLINCQKCDMIYLIKDSEIFSFGAHEYLLKNCSLYQDLWNRDNSKR